MSELVDARAAGGEAWPMYRAMVGIGLICGVLLVAAYELTKPIIERNKAEALARAIFQVLPQAASSKSFVLGDDGRFTPLEGVPAGQTIVYGGYDGDGRLVGVAVEAAGMGYQDTIRLLYGYSAEQNAIVGMKVLDSKETPGLGDKIIKDDAFVSGFDGARTPLVGVKANEGTGDPREVDMITGATISSRTVIGTINHRLEALGEAISAHAATAPSGPIAPTAPGDSLAQPAPVESSASAATGGEGGEEGS